MALFQAVEKASGFFDSLEKDTRRGVFLFA